MARTKEIGKGRACKPEGGVCQWTSFKPWAQFIGEAEAHTGHLPHGSKCSGPAAKNSNMAPHQWSYTSAALQGAGWHMLRGSAEEPQQENVHTALPELPDCLLTAVWNLYAMQI